jgi:RNA polymerase sigma-70 factor (ECF subfamily)
MAASGIPADHAAGLRSFGLKGLEMMAGMKTVGAGIKSNKQEAGSQDVDLCETVGHGLSGQFSAGKFRVDDSRDIVERISGGDESALSDLYQRFAVPVHQVARRILRSHECAQEIVCDVFVHAWQNATHYDPTRGSVRAWLIIATRHRAIDRLRSYRRYRVCSEQWAGGRPWTEPLHPDEILAQYQEGTSVHSALAAQTPLRRHLLAMAFFEDLTHEEISQEIGLPLGTVKSHLRRALKIMRGSF